MPELELRDQFAMAAVSGLMAGLGETEIYYEGVATMAYAQADAMLAARGETAIIPEQTRFTGERPEGYDGEIGTRGNFLIVGRNEIAIVTRPHTPIEADNAMAEYIAKCVRYAEGNR